MSTVILLPEMSPRQKREYFSRFLSTLKEMRGKHEVSLNMLDERIAWVESCLAELVEAEG